MTGAFLCSVILAAGTPGLSQTRNQTPGVVVGWGDRVMPYVAPGTRFTAVAAGEKQSLAVESDGTVVAWGQNDRGQSTVPAGLSGVVAVAAGDLCSLALKRDGTVVAWGDNSNGQTKVPAGLSGVVAVAARGHSLALKSDGTVVAWGDNYFGQSAVPAGLSGVVAVAAGELHSLALKSDGTVVPWGNNEYGQTTAPGGLSGVVAVAAGSYHSLALKSDGTVVAWGWNQNGQTTVPPGLGGVVAVAAGGDHSLALKSDGTVVAWGDNEYSQSTVPAGLSGVVAVAAGLDHSLALKSDGTVVVWGDNAESESTLPAGLSGVVAVAAGELHSLALKSDGTVVAWGTYNLGASSLPAGLSGVVAVAAGWSHSLALKSDGTVVAWGDNSYGQSTVPVGLRGVVAVAAGEFHSLAVKSDGTVVAWGCDEHFQRVTVPAGLNGVVAVAGGEDHSLALKGDGTVVAWGDNEYGQSAVPAGLSGVVAVAAGGYHSLALKSGGTVVAWGYNQYGQSTVPAGLKGVVAVAAGAYHSLALKSDGTVVAWGDNYLVQQSTVPAGLSGVVAVAAGGYHSLAIVAQPQGPGVAPDAATFFVSIRVGTVAERSFTVSNPGDTTLSGTASVAEPFSIIAGASYTLAPGQSQTVTIRYSPTAPGTDSGYVTFTGGGSTLTRQVMGSAFNDPTPLTGAIAGSVMSSGQPISGATITVIVPGPSFFGPGAISGQAGSYLVTGLAPSAHYEVMATPPMGQLQQFYMADLGNVAVTAGQTTTVNIELTPVNNQPPAPTAQNTPVVLVRGWGVDQSWADPGGDSDYWVWIASALIDAGVQYVWDCNEPEANVFGDGGHVINGELGIEPNAANLAAYIQQKALKHKSTTGFYPGQINIVAHSMGGLITRGLLGSSDHLKFTDPATNLPFTVRINKVVMLATPHCGSPIADAARGVVTFPILGGIPPSVFSQLGAQWDSTRDLTRFNMRYSFNPAYRAWPSTVPLYTFSASFGADDLIEWPLFAVTSEIIKEVNVSLGPDEITNDGFVTRASAGGVFWAYGLSWPPSLQSFTSVVLNPVQSATDLQYGRRLDHMSLLQDPAVAAWVVDALTGSSATPSFKGFLREGNPLGENPSAVSIRNPRGTLAAASLAGAAAGRTQATPLDVQPSLVQEFESAAGSLTLGTSVVARVVSDARTKLTFQVLASDTNTLLRLSDPSGNVIDTATARTNTNVQWSAIAATNLMLVSYEIADPVQGAWAAVIDGGYLSSTQAFYTLMVSGDSDVAMLPETGSVFSRGQDAVISCALLDLSANPPTPMPNASVSATIGFPDGSTNRLVLLDDGSHNDGLAGDGFFAAVMAGMRQPGQYSVSYRALGTNSQGQALQRVADGAFTVSSGHGSLWGDPAYESVDTDGDGIADFLEVKCWVSLTAAGSYVLVGDLVDASGSRRFSQSAAFAADDSGPTTATLIFDLAEMRAAGGQGTYHIENLQLFEVTSAGPAWLDAYRGSSVVNIQAAKPINVSPQNLATNVSPTVELRWADGGASSNYDVYFGTNGVGLSFKANQTGTTYGPGILAYNTAYYWRVDARNAAGITTGDVWTFATVPAAVQGASLAVRTNCFGFTIGGSSNLVIVVEACTNLAKPIWSPVGTNTLSGGLSYFTDPQWTNYPTRFYRLRFP